MFTADEAKDILTAVGKLAKSSKRQGCDFTASELFDLVLSILSQHDRQICIARSTFYRAIPKLGITANKKGYYGRSDAVLMIGWFARNPNEVRTYADYLESDSARYCSKYAA